MSRSYLPREVLIKWPFSPFSGRVVLAIGLMAACAFAAFCAINLSAQGLYYDEAHQVPAALAYLGKWPPIYAWSFVRGKPLMTMTYSGAIKSGIYGLYLRFTGSRFTVEGWRLFGITLVAVTFPIFSALARRRLSIAGLFMFFSLLLTDATVVLEVRHDWGPAALALALRMVFLGALLYGEGDRTARPRNSLLLGAIVGFAIFEKLSSLTLLPALGILMLRRERRTVGHWCACLAGCLAGVLPLLFANLLHLSVTGQLLSASDVAVQGDRSLAGLGRFLGEYLSLGDGGLVREFILGEVRGSAIPEAALLSVALAAILVRRWVVRDDRLPAVLVACYAAIGVGLFALPNRTWAHHWIIGTPFQYLAIALSIRSPDGTPARLPRLSWASRAVFLGALGALMILRVYGTLGLACRSPAGRRRIAGTRR